MPSKVASTASPAVRLFSCAALATTSIKSALVMTGYLLTGVAKLNLLKIRRAVSCRQASRDHSEFNSKCQQFFTLRNISPGSGGVLRRKPAPLLLEFLVNQSPKPRTLRPCNKSSLIDAPHKANA